MPYISNKKTAREPNQTPPKGAVRSRLNSPQIWKSSKPNVGSPCLKHSCRGTLICRLVFCHSHERVLLFVPESSFRGAGWMMFGVPKKHHPYRVKTAKEKRERDWEDKDFEMRWGTYSVTPNSQMFLLIYILPLFILMGIAGDFEMPNTKILIISQPGISWFSCHW